MKELVWVCYTCVLLCCAHAYSDHGETEIDDHRHGFKREEDIFQKNKEGKKFAEKIMEQTRASTKPDQENFVYTLINLDPHEIGLAREKKEKQMRIEEEDEKLQKEVLKSLDIRIANMKKEMEEREKLKTTIASKRDATTVHPLFRSKRIRTLKQSTTTEINYDVFTASSGLLSELEERRKKFTGMCATTGHIPSPLKNTLDIHN